MKWRFWVVGGLFVTGTLIRFGIAGMSPILPVNDGGMFYTMANDLLGNNFKLPKFTSYNHMDIPFAYPPLGIYILAVWHKLTGINMLTMERFVPPFFSSLTLIVFYMLAKKVIRPNWAAAAMAIFALWPGSFGWQVMGGGITRSLGMFMALMSVLQVANNRKKEGAVWLGLTVAVHPQWAMFAAISMGILFVKKSGLKDFFQMGAGAMILTSPWWLQVLINVGFKPYINSWLASGFYPQTPSNWIYIIPFCLGLVYAMFQNQKIFWWALAFLGLGFRNLENIASMQISIVMILSLKYIRESRKILGQGWAGLGLLGMTVVITAWLLLNLKAEIYIFGDRRYTNVLAEDMAAIGWIVQNTGKFDKFLVISRSDYFNYNQLIEWFPALSDRQSLLTIQGMEWLDGNMWNKNLKTYSELGRCKGQGWACVEKFLVKNNLNPEYLYIQTDGEENIRINTELATSANYRIVFQKEPVSLYQALAGK